MSTIIRKLDGLPIEEPVLDDEGKAKQKALADLIVTEYEKTGKLSSNKLQESIEKYEIEIQEHLLG